MRLPDNYNHHIGLQTTVGGARMQYMQACIGELMYSIIILAAGKNY